MVNTLWCKCKVVKTHHTLWNVSSSYCNTNNRYGHLHFDSKCWPAVLFVLFSMKMAMMTSLCALQWPWPSHPDGIQWQFCFNLRNLMFVKVSIYRREFFQLCEHHLQLTIGCARSCCFGPPAYLFQPSASLTQVISWCNDFISGFFCWQAKLLVEIYDEETFVSHFSPD